MNKVMSWVRLLLPVAEQVAKEIAIASTIEIISEEGEVETITRPYKVAKVRIKNDKRLRRKPQPKL